MSKLEELLSKLSEAGQAQNPKISEEDENYYSESDPRNVLSDTVNPYLEKAGLLTVPKVSNADRKRYFQNLFNPENMAGSFGMGSISNTNQFKELAKKFGGANLAVPELDKALSGKISKAFEDMKHDPHNPEVKEAYDSLINETLKQYDDLVTNGLKSNKIKDGSSPYKNSKDLADQVKSSNEISYFPTEEGFGSGAITDNPMLKKTGRLNSSGEDMAANDIFRVVHDVYGHVKPDSSFGPIGEEIAYQNHKQMFSPSAQKALATETRGQNSYVNFGPNATHNRANPANTIYADQKVGLLPDWAVNQNVATTAPETIPTSAFTGSGVNLDSSETNEDRFQKLKSLFNK